MKKNLSCFAVFLSLSILFNTMLLANARSFLQSTLKEDNSDCSKGVKVTYAPAVPSTKFLDIYKDSDIAMASFVARCSKLSEAYIWLHEESGGLIGAQILQGGPYGRVIAVGNVAGQAVGKRRVVFGSSIYLETGETYYLKLFKGEPATISGSVAAAAANSKETQGYNMLGPIGVDLAHELVFSQWTGTPPNNITFDARKKFPDDYKRNLNEALRANTDVFGERLLELPEGPTYENIKDYLSPLKLMGTAHTESGIYYIPFGRPLNFAGYGPVALHVGDGSQIISQVSAGAKTTIFVGADGAERYGFAEARLAQERLEDGYQPVLVTEYRDLSGVTYVQESFSDYTYATSELVSFVKIKVKKERASINKVKVALHFSDTDLSLTGGVLKSGSKVRALLSKGAKLIENNKVIYELDLSGGDQELYLARLLHPAECLSRETGASFHNTEKAELKEYWNTQLASGATFEVPEELVNNAKKGLIIQNLYMGYLYSIGNAYQTWYQPEGNDAARILGEYGFLTQQKAIHQVLLSVPFRRYRTWEMGELLSHVAQYFNISKDTAFMLDHKERLISYMQDFKTQMDRSDHGVLSAESFSGDISEKLVYLHQQAVAWRGMRDIAYIFKNIGSPSIGDKYLTVADSLRNRLLAGLDKSKTVLPDNSLFLPTELFTPKKPEPYSKITETKYGSYWNLCFPYAAASGLLDEQQLKGYYDYLKNYGGFFLGMVRFNYYPVPVGEFRRDGLSGYKTTGVDNVYGLNVSRVMAMLDDPDRLVLSMYAKLAHGMTRNTFISGEGDTLGPYPDEYYRSFYLSPSSFNNSWFLLMLRLMLITEREGKNGVPEKLHLAYATPRAWLEQGKQIKVADTPTPFGKIGYLINSNIRNQRIEVMVNMPAGSEAIPEIRMRLRTPGKKKIKSVRVNGDVHKAYDADEEVIVLTGKKGESTDFCSL